MVKSLKQTSTLWPESFTTGLNRSAWLCWRSFMTCVNQVSLGWCACAQVHVSACHTSWSRGHHAQLTDRASPPHRWRHPAGWSYAVWEQARPRHGSDLLPKHAGAGGRPGAPPIRVHAHVQQVRLSERSGVQDRQILRRHPGDQMSSDWHGQTEGGGPEKSGDAKRQRNISRPWKAVCTKRCLASGHVDLHLMLWFNPLWLFHMLCLQSAYW